MLSGAYEPVTARRLSFLPVAAWAARSKARTRGEIIQGALPVQSFSKPHLEGNFPTGRSRNCTRRMRRERARREAAAQPAIEAKRPRLVVDEAAAHAPA